LKLFLKKTSFNSIPAIFVFLSIKNSSKNPMKIVIIDYGAGNVTSVKNSFERLHVSTILSKNPEEIQSADKVIFPGQGEAKHAMQQLEKHNLIEVIKNLTQPVLGICVGMQLLCNHSEERHTKGLGIIPVEVKKFTISKTIPHMGWNKICTSNQFIKEFDQHFFYFAHSYFVPINQHTTASCQHEIEFSAIIEKDNFMGCQFHPEKSSEIGSQFIKTFLTKK
jgi:imidazole glycerol-phosphate synthase subunit HisH